MEEDDSQEDSFDQGPDPKTRTLRSSRKKLDRSDSREKCHNNSDMPQSRKRKNSSLEDDPSYSELEDEDAISEHQKKVRGYRCSPHLIPDLMEKLSPKQRQWVKNIDFHPLQQMIDSRMPKALTMWLIDRVDTELGTLEVCGVPVVIKEAIIGILNLPRGHIKVPPPLNGRNKSKRPKGEPSNSSEKHAARGRGKSVKDATEDLLKENEDEVEFCRSFLMLVLCIYLAPTTSLNINRNYLPSLMDVSKIKQMDWCGFIADYLIQGIKEYRKSKASHVQVPGCIHILPLIYVDALIKFKALEFPVSLTLPEGEPRIHYIGSEHLNHVAAADVISRSKDNIQFGLLQESCKSFAGVRHIAGESGSYKKADVCEENPCIPASSGIIEQKFAADFMGKMMIDIKETRKQTLKEFEAKLDIQEQNIVAKYQLILAEQMAAVVNNRPIEDNVMNTPPSNLPGKDTPSAEHVMAAKIGNTSNESRDMQPNRSSLLPTVIQTSNDQSEQLHLDQTTCTVDSRAINDTAQTIDKANTTIALEEKDQAVVLASDPQNLDSSSGVHLKDDSAEEEIEPMQGYASSSLEEEEAPCDRTRESNCLDSHVQDTTHSMPPISKDTNSDAAKAGLDLENARNELDIDPLQYAANIGNEAAHESICNRDSDFLEDTFHLHADGAAANLDGILNYDQSPATTSFHPEFAADSVKDPVDRIVIFGVQTPTADTIWSPSIRGPAVFDYSPAPPSIFQIFDKREAPPSVSGTTVCREPRTPAEAQNSPDRIIGSVDCSSNSILQSLTKAYESSMKYPATGIALSSQSPHPISSLNEYLSQFEQPSSDNESEDDDESDSETANLEPIDDCDNPPEEGMVSLSNEVYEGTPRYTVDAEDVIHIVDEGSNTPPNDTMHITPLKQAFHPGIRLRFGGSASKAIFKFFQTIKQLKEIDPVIADVMKCRLVLAKEADKSYKEHVESSPCRISARLRNSCNQMRARTKILIKGFHITTGEFVDALKPRGEVCQNLMGLCCVAIMLDWESKTKIILDQQIMSELLKEGRKCDHQTIAGRLRKLALDEINEIFLPVLSNKHWFLTVLNIGKELVEFFDSILDVVEGDHPYKELWKNLGANFRHAYCLAGGKTVDIDHFDIKYPTTRKQKTTFDCGFHVIQTLECHGTDDLVDYAKKKTMRPYRHYLCHSLIYHRFNDLNPLRTNLRHHEP